MNSADSAFAYHRSTAVGASPVGQVVALYDTIVRDLHRATGGMEAGDVEKRVAAVNHALLVIGELQGVLDFERGGEAARNLENYYKVIRGLILQGSMQGSRQILEEVIAMVVRVRAAWSQIEQQVPHSSTGFERSAVPSEDPNPVAAQNHPGTSDGSWKSTSGGWRA
jgi:flagellar protein FliS